MRSTLIESVSRRAYWIGIAAIMAGLIVIAIFTGMYHFEPHEFGDGPRVESGDPIAAMLYTPLGMIIILLILQFLAANILFWLGAWITFKIQSRLTSNPPQK